MNESPKSILYTVGAEKKRNSFRLRLELIICLTRLRFFRQEVKGRCRISFSSSLES